MRERVLSIKLDDTSIPLAGALYTTSPYTTSPFLPSLFLPCPRPCSLFLHPFLHLHLHLLSLHPVPPHPSFSISYSLSYFLLFLSLLHSFTFLFTIPCSLPHSHFSLFSSLSSLLAHAKHKCRENEIALDEHWERGRGREEERVYGSS